MKTFQTLGFQRTMYDEEDLRTSARKENPNITFSSPQFRKTWDRLDVDVHAGAAGTEFEVVSVTEAEFFRQTGKVLERHSPSPDVQQAARELQSRCGSSQATHADSVPSANQ